MKSIIHSIIVIIFTMMFLPIHASTLDLTPDKAALADWVKNTASVKTTSNQSIEIVNLVFKESAKYNIDPIFALGLIEQESGFNSKERSNKGAVGLMQVLVKAHRDKLKGRNPYRAEVSVEVGMMILSDCMIKAHNSLSKATKCYLGGNSKKYLASILKHQSSAERYMVEKLFTPRIEDSNFNGYELAMRNSRRNNIKTIIND